jgi:hypothetical protein
LYSTVHIGFNIHNGHSFTNQQIMPREWTNVKESDLLHSIIDVVGYVVLQSFWFCYLFITIKSTRNS